MGTERPSWTIYDTLSNINMSDHKLQPGGKISRDPSPRPGKTVQSDRERESKRVEDWRRDRENERMRDKERHKDLDPRDKYCERDRAPAPRPPREGERGWREMEKRQENERSKNGRPVSNIEKANERGLERGMKKGDTFPRITKISADGARKMMPTTGMDEERSERRQWERERRREPDDWERERDRVWQRERQGGRERYQEREREDFRSRGKEVRLVEDDKLQQWEKYQESDGGLQDKRERYATNKWNREREARVSSPHRRRERDVYSDRKEKEKAQRREGRRDIRSEGDSDEREFRRERMKETEREELTYQQSRSEGDNKGKTAKERDQERQRYREHDRQKYRDREGDRSKWEEGKRRGVDRDRERYRDHDRRTAREGEHMKQSLRDFKDDRSDRRDDRPREREHEQRGGRERKGREADPRWDEMTGRSSRSLSKTDPRVTPRTQSSGEWSSDMDSEPRRSRDSYEERESGRESTTESERDKWSPERTAERRRREQHRSERSDRDRGEMAGSVPEQRRMWLDPQRVKNSQVSLLEQESEERDAYRRQKEGQRQGERSVESQAEFLREGRQVKEDTDERYFDQSSYRGRQKESGRKEYKELKVEETEGVSVDREGWRETDRQGKGHLSDSDGGIGGSWQRDTEGENVTDNTEDSDREEERGSDYARSESEGGSERGWRQERMLSGEDGFVTVSSGGDEEDEREEEEEEFEDCVEFWEGEIVYDAASRFSFREYEGDEEREEDCMMGKEETVDEEDENTEGQERNKKYVFCVIGQTLPRSKPSDQSQSHVDQIGGAEKDESNLKSLHYVSDDVTLQPQYELKQTGNDEHAINNQDVEAERNLPREERPFEVDRVSSKVHDTHDVAMRGKVEHHYSDFGTLKRDSQTERLLVKWRERNPEGTEEKRESLSPIPSNPYGDVCTQVSYEQIQPTLEAMSPEEVEAIRIRMSGTWSVSEETKRHSQAPHLKWAKNVISEILGHSLEEQTDEEAQQNQGVNQSEAVMKDDKQVEETAQRHEEIPVVKVKLDGHSDPELQEEEEEEEEPLEVEGLRDEEDGRSQSWSEVDLRNVLDTIGRRKRNSKFFNAAQLYQQYSEAAQNFEILRQARSDVISVCEDASASPAPSPPPARRPLPPLPPVPHPHSLSHTGSVTSVKSLPLPEPPRSERRASSPRLSCSIGQLATLWRDLPAVRNSTELEELTEDQRRLQEVRFEVVTSEASYCRSLDIVVEHFVKSKQLGALLTTQDRNWLFSRLADVRAISHSFLSKLEEQVESDILHFTVCDVIARHCQRFKMVYVPYLTNQSYQDATYQRLMNENQGFKRTVEKLERSPVCQRLPLRSFLVLPFQRITRIKLLVQNIVKRTSPGTAEATQAIKALKLLEKLIQESNDSITQMRSIESLVSLSAKVDFECRTLPLISQSRRMVREGQVTELMDFSLKETERNIYMHLFNDYLLLSLQKEGGRFIVIDHAPVSDLRAENCRVKLHSLQKNLFRLHMSHKALLLRTDTQSDKLRWISALSRPHPEIDFSAAQDFPQMQCIRAFVAQQPDEQSLEKADVILVHQQSSDHWVEGTRLSDRQRGWIPESHLETITNSRVLQRNLSDALKLTTATAAV